jgi:hypothetical protein
MANMDRAVFMDDSFALVPNNRSMMAMLSLVGSGRYYALAA